MNVTAATFDECYAAALQAHMAGTSRGSPDLAVDLGREAVECGLGTLDVGLAHEQAIARLTPVASPAAGSTAVAPSAAEFLSGVLSPFLSADLPALRAGASAIDPQVPREQLLARIDAGTRELEEAGLTLRAREADLRRQIREHSALAEMSRAVASSLNISEVFEHFADLLGRVLPFDRIDIVTVDHQRGVFADLYVYDRTMPGWRQGETWPLRNTLVESVIRSDSGVLVSSSLAQSPPGAPHEGRTFPERFPSVIGVPLRRRDEAIGALLVRGSTVDGYGRAHLAFAERVGEQIAGAITNTRLHEETLRHAEEAERRGRLDAQNRDLRRLNAERTRFLSAISHELLTPLTIVRSFVELLIDDPNDNLTPEQREYLDTIERHTQQLQLTFSDLLDVSRISAGAFRIRRARFDARLLFEEFRRSYAPVVEARRQTLQIDSGTRAIWFLGDRGRLTQVLSNLVGNASKYSPEGSPIEVSARPDGDRLVVAVRDQGIGISEGDQRKLFVPFSRVENETTGMVGGSGLGLFIAKAIVELHGGEVRVDSEAGAGTTVRFDMRGLLPEGGHGAAEGAVSGEEENRAETHRQG